MALEDTWDLEAVLDAHLETLPLYSPLLVLDLGTHQGKHQFRGQQLLGTKGPIGKSQCGKIHHLFLG